MFLLQFNTTRNFDRQVCYSCKLTHARRSFRHFEHSLFLWCWYLRNMFLPLVLLNSQLPLHWINIETIFAPSWSSPSTRAMFCERRICLNNLILLKMHPHLYPWRKSWKFNLPLHQWRTWKKLVSAGEAGSRGSKLLWVHGCWDPLFPVCPPSK